MSETNDVIAFVTYGTRADQIFALRTQALGAAEGVTMTLSDADMLYCHGVIAIVNGDTDTRFANDLWRAKELGKQVFVAGSGQIPPDLLRHDLVMETRKLRVFEALRKLADAMCELREVCR